MTNIVLSKLLPAEFATIASALGEGGHADIREQLERVILPLQRLGGEPEHFSFMAYPMPRLDYEERTKTEVRAFESVALSLEGGEVVIDLDVFGQVNWFHFKGLPNVFQKLTVLLEKS